MVISSKVHNAVDKEVMQGIHVYRVPVFYLSRIPWAMAFPVSLWKFMDYIVNHYKIQIVHLQEIAFPFAFFATLHCKRKDLCCVTTARGSYFGLGWGLIPDLLLDFYVLLIGRLTLRFAEKVAVISKGQIPILLRLGVPRDKIMFAPLGINTDTSVFSKATERDRVEARKWLNLREEDFVVGFAGRLAPDKNVGLLIDLAKLLTEKIQNLRLLIIGAGVEESLLKEKVIRLGLKNSVLFLGWREDVDKILPAMDVFAFPSLSDGLGRAFIEAMAVGVPVVSSNVPGPSSVIMNGENGLLVPRNNVGAMANAILCLYQDSELRKQLSEQGTLVSKVFSWECCIEQLETMYKEALRTYASARKQRF